MFEIGFPELVLIAIVWWLVRPRYGNLLAACGVAAIVVVTLAGYALGGCWTHVGCAQSVVAYSFVQRTVASFTTKPIGPLAGMSTSPSKPVSPPVETALIR